MVSSIAYLTPVQTELARRYQDAHNTVTAALTAIGQIVTEDFPAPEDGDARPTRGDVDMLRALAGELSALVEGYEHP